MPFNYFIKFIFLVFIISSVASCGSGGGSTKKSISSESYSLSVNFSGDSNESGIDILPIEETCFEDCVKEIDINSTVTLIAKPDQGTVFSGWKGDCEQSLDCQLTLDKSKTITANFKSKSSTTYTIELKSNIGGLININNELLDCTSTCVKTFFAYELVYIYAQADEGYQFKNWDGQCSSMNYCYFIISDDLSLTANFTPKTAVITKELAINFEGSGLGKVSALELVQECTSSCILDVPIGTSIELTAESNSSDDYFAGWGGACSGISTCIVDMGSDNEVIAKFFPKPQYQLTLNANNGGEIKINESNIQCSSQCQYQVSQGDTLSFTPISSEGYEFDHWGGDCQGSTCTITIDKDSTISAFFSKSDNRVPITIKIVGSGAVTIPSLNESCLNECIVYFNNNSTAKLVATENTQTAFLNWNSVCEQQGHECEFNVGEVLTITAFFEEESIKPTTNTITIKEPIGKARAKLPIQIARPFIKGEISNIPRIRIDGQNVASQAVVKQRYDDGSVKHAILNFVLDYLPENSSVTANIVNDTNETFTPFNKEQLLASHINFDATFEYDFAGTVTTISARNMLVNNHYTLWNDGPIATTLLLHDHSTLRAFDSGNDEHRSIRSMFYVTYWKNLEQYSVRFVSENINTTTLQDQQYNVKLYLTTAENMVYQNLDINHQARTRWTKTFDNFENSPISIDHNLSYLLQTPSVPNFDTSKIIPDNKISLYWDEWQTRETDIYQKGFWQPAMASAGGRADIGLYPSWTVKWLYTGDWRLAEIAFTQADLSGNWPMHYREGDETRTFDFHQQVTGLGKIVSMAPGARPTHWTYRPTWHEINDTDKIPYIGDVASTIWQPDTAHHPDISSLQYLLSGDYYYLEQMLFSAAFVSGDSNAKAYKHSYGRGPTGSEGAMYSGEDRAQAWHLRTRVHTYDILPDEFHEKTYLGQLISNGIALWEGKYRLENSQPNLKVLYDFSFDNISTGFVGNNQPSQLGYWSSGIARTSYVNEKFIKTENVSRATAPWMQNFVVSAMGRAAELGWPTQRLLEYSSRPIRGIFSHDIEPNLLFAYVLPTQDSETRWFTSWIDVFNQYHTTYKDQLLINVANGKDTEHGYYSIAMTAAAYAKDQENGLKLWQFIQANIANKESYNSNPKWAIKPRE
ncbi:hypothetical protein AADZ91_08005 [Colwelliaceae bacterium 6441]